MGLKGVSGVRSGCNNTTGGGIIGRVWAEARVTQAVRRAFDSKRLLCLAFFGLSVVRCSLDTKDDAIEAYLYRYALLNMVHVYY